MGEKEKYNKMEKNNFNLQLFATSVPNPYTINIEKNLVVSANIVSTAKTDDFSLTLIRNQYIRYPTLSEFTAKGNVIVSNLIGYYESWGYTGGGENNGDDWYDNYFPIVIGIKHKENTSWITDITKETVVDKISGQTTPITISFEYDTATQIQIFINEYSNSSISRGTQYYAKGSVKYFPV